MLVENTDNCKNLILLMSFYFKLRKKKVKVPSPSPKEGKYLWRLGISCECLNLYVSVCQIYPKYFA